MYWQDLMVREAGDWVAQQRGAARQVPPTVEYAPWQVQVSRALELLKSLGMPGTVFPLSGAVRLAAGHQARDQLWLGCFEYLRHLDLPREPDERVELRTEEYPAKHVGRQELTTLLGMPSLGPGGRITEFQLASGGFADLTVRPVARTVSGGRWR